MRKYVLLFLVTLIPIIAPLFGAGSDPFGLMQKTQEQILINNRILAKVNGKAISVVDVMKKMDMLFYRRYPQYTAIPAARFQFYQLHWQYVLNELIDKELVMADASDNKMPLTSGDIRREMEESFGPNIIVNLDQAGLTFDEAWKMVQEELILKRMMYVRVNSKAVKRVTPQKIREAYEDFARKNQRPEQWEYQVIAIRHPDPVQGAEAAGQAYSMLVEDRKSPEDLLKEGIFDEKTSLTVSENFLHQENELSDAYKQVLQQLSIEDYSQPIQQKSRADKSLVFRIFYLKSHNLPGAPPFEEVVDKIQEELMQTAITEDTDAYLKKLRAHYQIQEKELKSFIPENFAPFVLK